MSEIIFQEIEFTPPCPPFYHFSYLSTLVIWIIISENIDFHLCTCIVCTIGCRFILIFKCYINIQKLSNYFHQRFQVARK